ncbi:hypothetical protein GUITHDRAFT_117367 [Guillardia theta CCMP2712]|uniref:DUF2779 domain-containing protein n=2 Tax=Guillardia theta TaxID=55529 RepID=L1IK38_GUITC|nr:hypothetical protein GUITHDRAFT_117367 [Guillardia theta CCMP2712]EKX36477.1 hypothetical protein GUITHDRAFT_117367 [Guillardia theta CCMP2712]|eukprot:XP_005823457.1 hypothetical protein GUITHDRAFT_117367 [Guillardia theta CCMP2712]
MNKFKADFPAYAARIDAVNARMIDFCKLAKETIYHPDLRGSHSIKDVLPALVPAYRTAYKDLPINNGRLAAVKFEAMKVADPQQAQVLRQNLLNYCKLDTLALVELHQAMLRML